MNFLKGSLNKSIVFFFPGIANYWNTITSCNIKSKPCNLGKYYLDFSSKAFYPGKFDDKGIPLYKYNNDFIYHPIVIAQYALGLFELIEEYNFREKFLSQSEWFLNNAAKNNSGASWVLNIKVDEYDIKSAWISAMAQGEAISVLTRAFLLTGDNKYMIAAESALFAFSQEVKSGGILNEFKGIKIFEEYPAARPTAVLNGFIFSIFGLFDLMLLGEKKSGELFIQSIQSLKKLLPYYDINYWSSYDLYNYPDYFPATYTYHLIHVEQLKTLYILTGEEMFNNYSLKWKAYSEKTYYKIKVLLKKIYLETKNKIK
jgi:heparosan-N-sulfate-glucuronate 5-epimerase